MALRKTNDLEVSKLSKRKEKILKELSNIFHLLPENLVIIIAEFCGFKLDYFGLCGRCDIVNLKRGIRGYQAHFQSFITYQRRLDRWHYGKYFPRPKSPSIYHQWSMETMSWVYVEDEELRRRIAIDLA